MDYPQEWNELPKHERRKKLKTLRRQQEEKSRLLKKIRNWGLAAAVLITGIFALSQLTGKSPEQLDLERQTAAASLEGKVDNFDIEGREHVPPGTNVEYQTNPPTSGGHLAEAKNWGIYDREIDDKAGVHNLEHGGIWITYKDLSAEEIHTLEQIGQQNPQSTLISPRSANLTKIAVVSWGKMMSLDSVDRALIQKYIDTYKNQSPERLAR